MTRRRALWLTLAVVSLIATYKLAVLASVSAKVLGSDKTFDWWHDRISRSTISIGPIPADVYTSRGSRFPLLLVHGVNETGKDAPEVKHVAEAFAGSGYRVVVPEFVRLTRQNVTPADVDDAVTVFQSLGGDAGIMCASYGCGPALIAASRPEIRDHVRFVAAFGSYFDLTDTLRFVITSPPSPLAYSKWRYMAANTDLIDSERDREALLEIARQRQDQQMEESSPPGEHLGADARAMLSLFESRNDAEFEARLAALPLLRDRAERLSPSRYIAGIRAHLIIVHIGLDPCVPSTEAVRMAQTAAAYHIPYSLTILDTFGHTRPAWPEFGIRTLLGFYLPDTFKFMRALNEILSFA